MSSNSSKSGARGAALNMPAASTARIVRLDTAGASHRLSPDYREYARIGRQARAGGLKK